MNGSVTLVRCGVFALAVFMLAARGHSKAQVVAQYLKDNLEGATRGVLPPRFVGQPTKIIA